MFHVKHPTASSVRGTDVPRETRHSAATRPGHGGGPRETPPRQPASSSDEVRGHPGLPGARRRRHEPTEERPRGAPRRRTPAGPGAALADRPSERAHEVPATLGSRAGVSRDPGLSGPSRRRAGARTTGGAPRDDGADTRPDADPEARPGCRTEGRHPLMRPGGTRRGTPPTEPIARARNRAT